jgi:poly(hydroxyalkanoate) depolymerase family esterase
MPSHRALSSIWRSLLVAGLLTATAPAGAPVAGASWSSAAELVEITGFGSNPGNLRMFRYAPDDLPRPAPVVVALHGCIQDVAGYDDEPGWTPLADQWKFIVVLPEQQPANNINRCFNWFEGADIARDQGEALSIKQMLDRTTLDYDVDRERIYVTGFSAGGAMTAVMLAAYPDVFAGGAIVAGLPYGCASSMPDAFACMNPGRDLTPQQWGDLVRGGSAHPGPWPILSLWHGAADTTVVPANLTELVEQWTNVHGTDAIPDTRDAVEEQIHETFTDAAGRTVVETYAIGAMGHGVAIDPGSEADSCGQPAAYVLDVDLCASYYIGRFWGIVKPDSAAPR